MTLSKKQKIGGVSAAVVLILAVILFFSFRGHSPKTTLKSVPVAQAPATATPSQASGPMSKSAKADKPPAIGAWYSFGEKAKAKVDGRRRWPPPAKIKGKPVVVPDGGRAEGRVQSQKTDNTNKEVIELLRRLVDQGIDVHLVGEPPANTTEPSAEEVQPAHPMTYEELGEAYKKAVHEGRPLP